MTRAVLIAPRSGSDLATAGGLRATTRAMELLGGAGVDLVGIVDPLAYLDALQMVIDGLADMVVVTRPDHMPIVRVLGQEDWFTEGVAGTPNLPRSRRTSILPRPEDIAREVAALPRPSQRRPRPIEHLDPASLPQVSSVPISRSGPIGPPGPIASEPAESAPADGPRRTEVVRRQMRGRTRMVRRAS